MQINHSDTVKIIFKKIKIEPKTKLSKRKERIKQKKLLQKELAIILGKEIKERHPLSYHKILNQPND